MKDVEPVADELAIAALRLDDIGSDGPARRHLLAGRVL